METKHNGLSPERNVLCLFDVDGTLTPPREVSCHPAAARVSPTGFITAPPPSSADPQHTLSSDITDSFMHISFTLFAPPP